MRTLGGLFFAVLFAAALPAQNGGNAQPIATGGTAATVSRHAGGPRIMVPGTTTRPGQRVAAGTYFVYADPIYVPQFDPAAHTAPAPAPAPAQPAAGVVIYMSQPAPAAVETVHPSIQVLGTAATQPAAEPPAADRFLFAFNDHSIYSAVAYWVDGGTLHYFTSGDTHKQAPLSTLDRAFTERLNRGSGSALKLPPEKP